jgi:hypothetical protein
MEGRKNGDLGPVAPYSGVPLNLQMNETHNLIRLLRVYIPRNWEFGSALANIHNFGTPLLFYDIELQGGDAAQWLRTLLEAIRGDKNQNTTPTAGCMWPVQ